MPLCFFFRLYNNVHHTTWGCVNNFLAQIYNTCGFTLNSLSFRYQGNVTPRLNSSTFFQFLLHFLPLFPLMRPLLLKPAHVGPVSHKLTLSIFDILTLFVNLFPLFQRFFQSSLFKSISNFYPYPPLRCPSEHKGAMVEMSLFEIGQLFKTLRRCQ